MDEVSAVFMRKKENLRAIKDHFDALEQAHEPMTETKFVEYFLPLVIVHRGQKPDNIAMLQRLYMSIDALDNQVITWEDFSFYMLLQSERLHHLTPDQVPRDFNATVLPNETINNSHVLHKERIVRVLVHGRPHRYATASEDGKVKYWNATTLMHEKTVHNTTTKITDFIYSPELGCFLVASMDRTICMYDAIGGELVKAFRGRRKYGARDSDMSELMSQRRERFTVPILYNKDQLFRSHTADASLGNAETTPHVLEHFKQFDDVHFVALRDLGFKRTTSNDSVVWENLGYPTALAVLPPSTPNSGKDRLIVGLQSGDLQVYPVSASHSFTDVVIHCIMFVSAHNGPVNAIISIPKLGAVVTAGDDALIRLWKATSLDEMSKKPLGRGVMHAHVGKTHHRPAAGGDSTQGHTKPITRLAWYDAKNNETSLLISIGYDKEIFLWNPYIQAPLARLEGHHASVIDIAVNAEDCQLFSLAEDNVINIWDIRTFRLIQSLQDKSFAAGTTALRAMLFDPKRAAMIVCNRELNVWPMVRSVGNFPSNYVGHRQCVVSMVYCPRFQVIITADQSGILSWNCGTREVGLRLVIPEKINELALDHTQRCVLIACQNGDTLIYNILSFKLLRRLRHVMMPVPDIDTVPATGDEALITIPCSLEKPKHTDMFASAGKSHIYLYEAKKESVKPYPDRVFCLDPRKSIYCMVDQPSALIVGSSDALLYVALDEASDRITELQEEASLPESSGAPSTTWVSVHLGPLHLESNVSLRRCFGLEDKAEIEHRSPSVFSAQSMEHTGPNRRMRRTPNPDLFSQNVVECLVKVTRVPGLVIAGRGNGMMQFWDIPFMTQVFSFRGTWIAGDSMYTIRLDHDELRMYTGDVHGYVVCYEISGIASVPNQRTNPLEIDPHSIRRLWFRKFHESSITGIEIPLNQGLLFVSSADSFVSLWHDDGTPFGMLGSSHPMSKHKQTLSVSKVLDCYRAEALMSYMQESGECSLDHLCDFANHTENFLFSSDCILDINRSECVKRLIKALQENHDDHLPPLVLKKAPGCYSCNINLNVCSSFSPVSVHSKLVSATKSAVETPSPGPESRVMRRSIYCSPMFAAVEAEDTQLPLPISRHQVSVKLPLILKPGRQRIDASAAVMSLLNAGTPDPSGGTPFLLLPPDPLFLGAKTVSEKAIIVLQDAVDEKLQFAESCRRFHAKYSTRDNLFIPPITPLQLELERVQYFRRTDGGALATATTSRSVVFKGDNTTWTWAGAEASAPLELLPRAPGTFELSQEVEESCQRAKETTPTLGTQDPDCESDMIALQPRVPKFTGRPSRKARQHYAIMGPDTPEPHEIMTALRPEQITADGGGTTLMIPLAQLRAEDAEEGIEVVAVPRLPILPRLPLTSVSATAPSTSRSAIQRLDEKTPNKEPQREEVRAGAHTDRTFRFRKNHRPIQKYNVREHVYTHLRIHAPAEIEVPQFGTKDFKGDGQHQSTWRRTSLVGSGLGDKVVGVRANIQGQPKKKLAKKATFLETAGVGPLE